MKHVTDLRQQQGARLAAARKAAGFRSASEAASHFGWPISTYTAHEAGRRTIGQDDAEKYARRLGTTTAPHILFGGKDGSGTSDDQPPHAIELPGLPIVGEVAAGAWLDPEEMDEPRAPQFFVPPDPRFPFASQRVWIVRGRSIERTAREGEALVCVLVDHSGVEASDGDLVIAERRRDQGALIERTAKRLRIFRDRSELWPEYMDPQHNAPLTLNEGSADGDIEVRIVAVVKGIYRAMS